MDKYFHAFESLLREEIEKEKARLNQIIRKILLTEITTDEKRLNTILALYTNDLAKVSCKQVGSVTEELFNFRHRNISSYGFRKFIEYVKDMQIDVNSRVSEIITSKSWERLFLKNCEKEISFLDVEEPIILRASRVKTEEDSPKKTLRRSMKKEIKKNDLKEINVQLKKSLELTGSKLVDSRE